jgi:hypothetical protein
MHPNMCQGNGGWTVAAQEQRYDTSGSFVAVAEPLVISSARARLFHHPI